MPRLLSFSNELLIQIFTACPTIQSALRLSSVDKQTRAVWLRHMDHIVEGIIKSTIPAAEQVIGFAITETRLRSSLSDDERPPLPLWLPNLILNAELCSSASLRRVLLAFEYNQLRDAVHAELRAVSKETREEFFRFHWFLIRFASRDEVIRQGVPLDLRFPGPPEPGEDDNDMHEDAWRYQDDVINSARGDLTNAPDDLSLAIQGYVT